MPVELYHAALSPPCRAVVVLGRLINLDLKLIPVDMAEKAHLKPEFLKVNPFHTIPALKDGSFHLFESRAILVYLTSKYAPGNPLYPADHQERALVDAMLNFDVGTLAAGITRRLQSILLTGKDVHEMALETGRDNLKCLDHVLSTRNYSAGDHLTLADISIIHTLSILQAMNEDLSSYPHLQNYIVRIHTELSDTYNEVNKTATEQMRDAVTSKKC